MKKTISLLLCLVITILSLTSCGIFSKPRLKFTRDGDGYAVKARLFTNYIDVEIPEKHFGRPVTKIAPGAFEYTAHLRSVKIPDTVVEIGDSAFNGCDKLMTVNIPDSVTTIGANAFRSCKRLTNVELPENIQEIKMGAFHDCDSITSITIPKSINKLSTDAFTNCDRLYVVYNNSKFEIKIEGEKANDIFSRAVIIFDKDILTTRNDGYEYALNSKSFLYAYKDDKYYLMAYCGKNDTVTLPETINGNEYEIHKMSGAINVVIPQNITTLPENAFEKSYCLRSITIPEGTTVIPKNAFAYCEGLNTVILPASLTTIEYSAFYSCNGITKVYYKGTTESWKNISIEWYNTNLTGSARFYFSAEKPLSDGRYWYLDSKGNIQEWNTEN